MSRGRRGIVVLGATLALSLYPFRSVAATTGPYTLPFMIPYSQTQGYGCTEFAGEGSFEGRNADLVDWDCATTDPDNPYFHNGIDYGLTYDAVVASRAGMVESFVESRDDHTSGCGGGSGNYVVLNHGDNQYSIYYHLKENGVVVSAGQEVSVGQMLATSGNSGYSCGAHLHYQLANHPDHFTTDAYTFNPAGKWTTSSGRVPWMAHFVSQLGGTGMVESVELCYGEATTYWVKYQNKGGLTWSPFNDDNDPPRGRITLYSTDIDGNAAQDSQFHTADWETAARVGPADEASVAPDGTGTFTFGLYGNGTPLQTYTIRFNLNASGQHWFIYDNDPDKNHIRLDIFIIPHQACG